MKQLALRVTMYAPHDLSPTTVVMLESSLTLPIEEVISTHGAATPGAFHVFDVFETESDLVRATIHGQERVRPEEQNMAVAYYWNARMLQRAPVVINERPAPLKVEDIETVLAQLARHPNYSPQKRVVMHTTLSGGHTFVELAGGEVKRSG